MTAGLGVEVGGPRRPRDEPYLSSSTLASRQKRLSCFMQRDA